MGVHKLWGNSLRYQLSMCLVLLVLVLTTIIGWISIKISQQVVRNNIAYFSSSVLSQASGRLGSIISNAELIADKIIINDALNSLLTDLSSENRVKVLRARLKLQDLLRRYRESLPGLKEIIIMDEHGHVVSDDELRVNSTRFTGLKWHNGALKRWRLRYISIVRQDGQIDDERLLELNARIIQLPERNQTGLLILRLDYQLIESIMIGISLDNGSVDRINNITTVLNSQGEVIFPWIFSKQNTIADIRLRMNTNLDLRRGVISEQKIEGKKYLVAAIRDLSSGWEIYTWAPTKNLYSGLDEILIQVLRMGILFALVAIILSTLFAFLITQPLAKLERIMHRVEEGELVIRAPETGPHELQTLSRTFNKMLNKVDDLTRMLVAEERHRKILAIHALQAQITPHFLFNTLAALAGMTLKRPASEIVDALHALMRLLSISIGRDGDLITLADEFEHIQHYIYLMGIRYPHRFTSEIVLPQELQHLLTVRLIIQPLVENSFQHGLKSHGGLIKIIAHKENNNILIDVCDNGCGMASEQLNKLWQREREQPGIGVRNVDERLKLTFGPAYGLTVKTSPGGGTNVTIRIPIVDLVRSELGEITQ